MQIREEDNRRLAIPKPKKMNCDTPLKVPYPLEMGSQFTLVVGAPGSGKTSLVLGSLFAGKAKALYNQVFNQVWVCSPSLGTLPRALNLPRERIMTKLEELGRVETAIERLGKRDRLCLIIDDHAQGLSSAHSAQRLLTRLAYNRRHFGAGLSCFILVQRYRALPRPLRIACSCVYIFRTMNGKEIEAIHEEQGADTSRTQFDQLLAHCFKQGPHHFLYIRNDLPPERRWFCKYNQLHLKRDSMYY